ncbi:hypothetical protein [Shewanella sp. MEBiC00475]|uniref:DUF6933 domain-containing protein n=1 Tax=Shewanella sp. MEBiC00475 TaxID=2575361 RepID=UPI0010C0D179|nr:hypothetical protein [Shewanella sp. MEBiC00475]
MLVFNCTKAAADFFTVIRKGETYCFLEPAPHKTIAESIECPVFPSDVDVNDNSGFQWQWVVHCVKIKRKKYLLVMDYLSRFCLTFPAPKKGEQYDFLNTFEGYLKSTFECLGNDTGLDNIDIEIAIEGYDHKVNTCAFHSRSDRSVQAHLNDVHWHLERHCYEDYMLSEPVDLIGFNLKMAHFIRNAKGHESHFFPYKEFIHFWLYAFVQYDTDTSNIVYLSDYRK